MKLTAKALHSALATTRDPRWMAVISRDRSRDGQFVYSVKTTGVYCRPACSSRRANPANVRFHATAAAAETAGFRPCLRCKPNGISNEQALAAKVAEACRLIEAAEAPPNLATLARSANLSPHHFHRVFKAAIGLTPKGYALAHRAKRLRTHLPESPTITEAVFEAGFNSNSRFYETSMATLGMTPGAYRDRGANAEIRFAVGQCSLGAILVGASDRGVCAILLGDDPAALLKDFQDRFCKAQLVGGDNEFEALVAKVVGFVDAPAIGLDLPLDVRGTAFQQRVWRALTRIPIGTTVSYSEVARSIGAPSAVRAVAQACAANSLAVAIPCHRVVRNDGNLSGYRWGVERKRELLEREASGAARERRISA